MQSTNKEQEEIISDVMVNLATALKSFKDHKIGISYLINTLGKKYSLNEIQTTFAAAVEVMKHEKSRISFYMILIEAPLAESSGVIHEVNDLFESALNKVHSNSIDNLTIPETITLGTQMFLQSFQKSFPKDTLMNEA